MLESNASARRLGIRPFDNALLRILLVCGFFLIATTGCTHLQLRSNAVNEAFTVGDLEQQQVLNNLAMFVYNPNSLPFFSYPNQTATTVTDQGMVAASAAWTRPITSGTTATSTPKHFGDFLFGMLGLNTMAQRMSQEGLVVTPVNDPRKLELMRCAYQTAVSNCCPNAVSRTCPDCQTRFNTFYTGDPNGKVDQASGAITSQCLKSDCWFHVGCEKQVPKDCPCTYVGHYCGVYVWVLADGRDGLSRLTLAILDYAIHDPPVQLTKQVVYNIDELGLPTNKDGAVATVSATVGINERPESLLNVLQPDELRIEDKLKRRLKVIQDKIDRKSKDDDVKQLNTEADEINKKLDFLDEQLHAGSLKQQFYPGSVSPTTPLINLPALQQSQNALTPSQ